MQFSWKNGLRQGQADRRRGRRARPAECFRPRLERLESRTLLSFLFGGSFAAGSTPYSLAVVDVNNDGKPDLVAANDGSDNVSVLLGNDNGIFQDPVTYSVDLMTGLVTFNTAPASGLTITADYSYYFRCRFIDDSYAFENFMFQLWQLKKLTFISVRS